MKTIFSNYTDVLSDTTTPVNAYFNLRDIFSSVSLFESSDYHSKENSKSFIGVNPLVTLKVEGGQLEVLENNELIKSVVFSGIEQLDDQIKQYDFREESLHHINGFFGYCAYDAIQYFESIPRVKKEKYQDLPELLFSIFEYVIVFDNFSNQTRIIANSIASEPSNFSKITHALNGLTFQNYKFEVKGEERANQTNEAFKDLVMKGKDHVKRGDVFQIVLSRCFEQDYVGDDFQVYRQLRATNPSPYMFYLDIGKAKLFGTSPEAQIKVENALAEIHPIAGTIQRPKDGVDQQPQVEALKNDPKENAEHVMLVDLARNDLNRSCTEVKVSEYKRIQYFSHVIHMVSKVTGELERDKSLLTFSNTFPAGTLSGAPKFKAMSLIQDYEPHNRGFYGGAVGHISPNGRINMAIVIRSCLSYQNCLHYQAGAGIVYDSNPDSELEEVNQKIKAVRQAIKKAKNKII